MFTLDSLDSDLLGHLPASKRSVQPCDPGTRPLPLDYRQPLSTARGDPGEVDGGPTAPVGGAARTLRAPNGHLYYRRAYPPYFGGSRDQEMTTRRRLAGLRYGLLCPFAVAASTGVLHGQRLLEVEGIELRGGARVVEYGAGTCNVSEERETAASYERKKANHGQPVDVWQLDFSVYNGSGRPLDHLIANYRVASENPPCTNWSWPDAGRYPGPIEWGDLAGFIQRSGSGNPTPPGETLSGHEVRPSPSTTTPRASTPGASTTPSPPRPLPEPRIHRCPPVARTSAPNRAVSGSIHPTPQSAGFRAPPPFPSPARVRRAPANPWAPSAGWK